MRPDLGELEPGEQEIAELQLLLARRRDLITDRSRTIARLRETLLSLFAALERALDLNGKGPLTLLSHYQSPAQLRRAGHKRVAAYLRNRGVLYRSRGLPTHITFLASSLSISPSPS
jgi:hypothetical protein